MVEISKLRYSGSRFRGVKITKRMREELRLVPIEQWQPIVLINGFVVDGLRRIALAKELGHTQIPAILR